MPHPVRLFGFLIEKLEKTIRAALPATPRGELLGGRLLVFILCALAFFVPLFLLWLLGRLNPLIPLVVQAWVAYQVLALKSLKDAALQVLRHLLAGDLPSARAAVGQIVGRDTQTLDEAGVTRAAVETVAENTSDGIIAPLFYFALGGAPLALLYKAINTMDSMLGYKNSAYLYFGRTAARLDDLVNFIPARLSGLLLVAAALFGRMDAKRAARIVRRDHAKHTSPNAGWPEAACAGALGVVLGGPSVYGGTVVEKPFMGDDTRPIEPLDIQKTNTLLTLSACLALLLCTAVRLCVYFILF